MSKKKKFALLEEDNSFNNLNEELLTINITRSPSYDKVSEAQTGKRSQKKCKRFKLSLLLLITYLLYRCREFYYDDENQDVVCKSHPGVFTEPSLTKGTQIGNE
jgi:hypothetical protein